VLPVQAQGPGSPVCCVRASAGWRGTAAGGLAWRRGCLILVTCYGCGPASAATARGTSAHATCPAVAADPPSCPGPRSAGWPSLPDLPV